MTIVYTRRALRHLQAIREWIEKDNPAAAERVATRIVGAVERLDLFPYSGRKSSVRGVRELVVPGLPYIVRYRVLKRGVEILVVLHAKQRRD